MDKNIIDFSLTLYGEGRGEPVEGQVGIGSVIRNRVQSTYRGAKSYSDVCLAPLQFSCWNEHDPNRAKLLELSGMLLAGLIPPDLSYRQCLWVAQGIMNSDLRDNTSGASHYLLTALFQSVNCPGWAGAGKIKAKLGAHTFILTK